MSNSNEHKPAMTCRPGCGACCIAPSISSFIPGMPYGKPAGVRCIQLDPYQRCKLFGLPTRPKVCLSFAPTMEVCGNSREYAMIQLARWEQATA